jgi:hypothetical protein
MNFYRTPKPGPRAYPKNWLQEKIMERVRSRGFVTSQWVAEERGRFNGSSLDRNVNRAVASRALRTLVLKGLVVKERLTIAVGGVTKYTIIHPTVYRRKNYKGDYPLSEMPTSMTWSVRRGDITSPNEEADIIYAPRKHRLDRPTRAGRRFRNRAEEVVQLLWQFASGAEDKGASGTDDQTVNGR